MSGVDPTPRQLDESTIAAVRSRIGIPVRYSPRNHNEVSSTDSFRHFARAYGDDNPIYDVVAHAEESSWNGPIAPPLYPLTAGIARPVDWTDAEKALMRSGDPLAGIGQYMCGERWVLARPVRAGDLLWQSQTMHSAELRSSSFAGGRGALVSHRVTWDDEAGSPFAVRMLDFWHAEREGSNRAGTNRTIERTVYTPDQVAELDAYHEQETRRGEVPRTVADVVVGEELGPIAKGPLSVTDVVNWHIGVGWGMYGGGTSKVAYENRRRVPRFYINNDFGFWDSAQACHWDDRWAQRLGHPAPYDYGVMRTNWMVHLVTNWMGDDAWVWKISASVRKFNYHGDAHIVSGVVRHVDPEQHTATLTVSGVNQRGETTCDAEIVVILPASTSGHAQIPAFDIDQLPEAIAP
jgi:acyl dehydratase